VVFNDQKTYKDLQMKRNTSESDLGVEPRSTLEQQGVAHSEFVELEDASMGKARNIPEGNVES